MSYNSELQSNNIDLQTVLNTINTLPVHEDISPELTEQDTLIAQIQTALSGKAGGGLPESVTAVASGTFTPVSDTYEEFIPHGLGVTPTCVYYYAEGSPNIADFPNYAVCGSIEISSVIDGDQTVPAFVTVMYGYEKSTGSVIADFNIAWLVDQSAVEEVLVNSTSFLSGWHPFPVKAGVTYKWVACATE